MSSLELKIRDIQKDDGLTNDEKNRKIQDLMLGKYKTIPVESNEMEKCDHYEKSCSSFEFECCDIVDPCKRCHVERKICENSKVKSIVCLKCKRKQKPSFSCVQCHEQFSKNYCSICQLWTMKDTFHCNECGLCRVGKKENTFHCDKCKVCFSTLGGPHQCPNISFEGAMCVVCNEAIFNNQNQSFPLECGHFIHRPCFDKYIEFNNYNCPHCKKSMCDMKESWNNIRHMIQSNPLPKDFIQHRENDIVPSIFGKFQFVKIENEMYYGNFIDWKLRNGQYATGILNKKSITPTVFVSIYCNDCNKKSDTLYHVFGLECKNCGSFNTQQ